MNNQQWQRKDNAIEKEFRFKDFKTAIRFMVKAGEAADKMNHHPEWTNIYNRVKVRLTTHDQGGVTKKDLELAKRIDEAAGG